MSEAAKAATRMTFGEMEEDEFQDEAPRAKVGVAQGRVSLAPGKWLQRWNRRKGVGWSLDDGNVLRVVQSVRHG